MMLGIAPRVALIVSLILAILITTQTWLFSRQSSLNLEELMGARLESIAATAALSVDGDTHEQVRSKDDASHDGYRALQANLAQVATANDVKPHLVYTLRPKGTGSAMEFVVMADSTRNDVGNMYRMVPPELAKVLASGMAAHRGRYTTENGVWISGFAPIKTSNGKTVALLEVDQEITDFLTRNEAQTMQSIAVAMLVLLAGVVLVFLAVRAITSRIVRLTELADSISRGEVEKRVPAMGGDEVGRLANALERLRESVRTSMELLRSS